MLDRIRNSKNSIVILVAFAAIILVFIFWGAGPGGDSADDRNVVAVVDGTKIESKEYMTLYKRELDYYKETFKDQPIAEIERRLDLKGRAIGILVNRTIALKAAKQLGMKASQSDVQQAIQSMEVFSSNGAFDKKVYFDVLASNRINPAEFEKGVEEDLLAARMREKITEGVSVTEEEVKDAYFMINRKVDLDFVAISPERFIKDVKVTDDEAKAHLKENASQFMEPARVKVFYAYAPYDVFGAVTKVTDEEIKADYEADSDKYMTAAKVRARHILISPEAKGADDMGAATQVARAKAEKVLEELKAGGDFSALAKKYSKDQGSAKQGGELGWFERGVMIKPFEDAAFNMSNGETSGVVETEFGFHIIKLEEKVESAPKPLKDVKAEIKEKLAKKKAALAASEASASIAASFRDAATEEELSKAVSAHPGVKGGVTPLFSYGDKKVDLVKNEMVSDVVFSMRQNDVSRLLETPQGIYVVKAVEKINPRVREYEAVATEIKSMLTAKKAFEAAGAKARLFLERLKNKEALGKIAAEAKLKVDRTGYFSLVEGFVPKVGVFAGDRPELFSLTEKEPGYTDVITHENIFYLFSLARSMEADDSGFGAMRDDISKRLLADKQEQAVSSWFEKKRAEAKIQVFDDRL